MSHQSNPSYEENELESFGATPNYNRWILDGIRPHLSGDGIELGAEIGTMSQRIQPNLNTLDIVEPSEILIPKLRREFTPQPGIRNFQDTLESFTALRSPNAYYCAVMVNMLEHIEEKSAIEGEMFRLLHAGGNRLVFVPTMKFLFGDLDRRFSYFFCYFDLRGVLPWWLINTIYGVTEYNPRLTKTYDDCGDRAIRAPGSEIPPPIGKNPLLIARQAKDR